MIPLASSDPNLSELPTGPCPSCSGEAARQAVHDHAYDMKHDPTIPERARCEFEERFGQAIVRIADWAAEYAEDVSRRDDHTYCDQHRLSPTN